MSLALRLYSVRGTYWKYRLNAAFSLFLLRPSDFYIFRGAIIKSQKLFWFLCKEIRKILRKACGVENTALQHLMLLFSLNAPDKVRSRKTGQAALSRYEKARSAKKYRAKRRGSPAACHVFQRKHFIRGWVIRGCFLREQGFLRSSLQWKKSEKNAKKN